MNEKYEHDEKGDLTDAGAEAMLRDRGEGLAAALREKGFEAQCSRNWFRVYLNGYGRDIKAYFEMEPDGFEFNPTKPMYGTGLKVFSNCNQDRAWLLNRCKQVKHAIMTQLCEAGLQDKVCKDWRRVILC